MRVGRRKRIVFIVGPTAVGKTAAAVACASRMKGEIVSADSMQVYRGMRILSQAPSRAELRRVKHHLVAYADPSQEASVAAYRERALRAIRAILKRGKTPIVVGGSGLYVRALIDGLFPTPPADEPFRRRAKAFAARHGSARLHEKLAAIDPISAGRIHPNDERRIIRALEIHHTTGRTMTELAAETTGLAAEYDVRIYGLNRPRRELYAAIDARADRMFAAGVIREVKRLAKKKLSRTAAAMLGYGEICGYLGGEHGLDEAKALIKMNTRRFAKRQLSWFRADDRIRWFDVKRLGRKRTVDAIVRDAWKKRSW